MISVTYDRSPYGVSVSEVSEGMSEITSRQSKSHGGMDSNVRSCRWGRLNGENVEGGGETALATS